MNKTNNDVHIQLLHVKLYLAKLCAFSAALTQGQWFDSWWEETLIIFVVLSAVHRTNT